MKYRHRGYQDSDHRKDERKSPPRPRTPQTPQERGLKHMMERSATLVLRCHQCNAVVTSLDDVTSTSTCSGCGAALHASRNCKHFDTGCRWECNAPIEEAVQDKTVANNCSLFEANTVLDATGRRSDNSAPSNARAAFASGLDARGFLELGRMYKAARLKHAAIDLFKKSVELNGDSPDALRALGDAYMSIGKKKQGREYRAKADSHAGG